MASSSVRVLGCRLLVTSWKKSLTNSQRSLEAKVGSHDSPLAKRNAARAKVTMRKGDGPVTRDSKTTLSDRASLPKTDLTIGAESDLTEHAKVGRDK